MTLTSTETPPIRFEDEYPEAAAALVRIFKWPKGIINWILRDFGDGTAKVLDGYRLYVHDPKIRVKLPSPNEPCRCGSTIKFKKCCFPVVS